MLLSKSQLKHPLVDSPPPTKRGKKVLYGSASMMLAFMVGSAPYAVAQDDDSDKNIRGTIQFTKGKYEVPEMAGKAVLCVERRGGNKGDVMAMYGTTSDSAKPGSDYMPKIGHIMWHDGDDSTKPVVIHIKKDKAKEEKKESFYVTLLDMAHMDMGGMPKDGMMPQDGMPQDGMQKDGMQKDGMPPPDGMQKDGMPPPDGMQKDGMPPPDGGMQPPNDMPPPEGMQKDGMQPPNGMQKDGMPKDGMPPKDGMSKDGMMPDDMAQYWQYCMPEGEMPEDMSKDDMSKDNMMPDGEMMDEMGHPDTVYFGGRFQAEVNILDNKEPPPPPPGQTKPKPDKPGKPGSKPGQPGQDKPDTSPSGDDDDDRPSSMTQGDGPATSEGEQIEVVTGSQKLTSIFSINITQVITIEEGVSVVTNAAFGVSNIFTVGKNHKKGKKTRSGGNELDGTSSAFLDGLGKALGGSINTVTTGSDGSVAADVEGAGFGVSFRAYNPSPCDTPKGLYTTDTGGMGLAFINDQGKTLCSDVDFALAPQLTEAIAESGLCQELLVDGSTVTCTTADGSVTVIPNPVITEAECGDLTLNSTDNGFVLCGTVSQEVSTK